MEKLSLNKNWRCYPKGKEDQAIQVQVPHDAMQLDSKSPTSPGGVNTGWYEAQDYIYEKELEVDIKQDRHYVLEFEGVYHKATVWVNDQKVAYQDYGYSGFFVDVTEKLKIGESNHIKVEAVNSDQPNSRWYSGTGIYRPVWLYVYPEEYILPEEIRITTLNYQTREIQVDVKTTGAGTVQVEILDQEAHILGTIASETTGQVSVKLALPEAELWDPENPVLHRCRVTFGQDVQEETFGIRTIHMNETDGLTMNGKRVIIRGACIHHDNGFLGARAYDFAEQRKIRILRENGYNAVRSAHNPCSKAMLRACDEQGMLMMDEYVDVWYIHKTKYDYATKVEKNYQEDLRKLVAKDYNHPSVILYSTGNEVSETAQKKGIQLCADLTKCLHKLDPTRPVTCGVNIFFNFLSSMGFGVYSDKKAEQEVENVKKKKAVGSEFFNNLAGLLGADFMKFGATLYPCDVKTRDAFAAMDAAGYNYGINRYEHDLKKYPKRMILGSETFCSDAYRFWEMAKKEKRIIGDFVWAGMDYLGEVGVGSWLYEDYAPDFGLGMGWVSAGSGRIDLTGKALAEMDYTKVAFELLDMAMAVRPVCYDGKKHSPSAWKMTDAMASWTWPGCEGKEAQVEVYARGHHVALYLDDTRLAEKRLKNDCKVIFQTTYQPGTLRAVCYDENGKILTETQLRTAGDHTILRAEPELSQVRKDDQLCYVRFRYTDTEGLLKPMARGEIQVQVKGGKLLGIGSACPYYTKNYLGDECDTYYGEAMAIIEPGEDQQIELTATSKYGEAQVQIPIV